MGVLHDVAFDDEGVCGVAWVEMAVLDEVLLDVEATEMLDHNLLSIREGL